MTDRPRVTEILGTYDMGWLRFYFKKHGTFDAAEAYSQQAKERGTRIHKAFEMLLKREALPLALEQVEEAERRAVTGLDGWIRGAEVMSLQEEKGVVSERKNYKGHFDHELIIQNPDGWVRSTDFFNNPVELVKPFHCLSDLKTQDGREVKPSEMKKHGMQLAAYSYANEEDTGEFIDSGLIVNVDIQTGEVDAIPVVPLSLYLKPFFLQRDIYDYIQSEGEYENLRRRKRVA